MTRCHVVPKILFRKDWSSAEEKQFLTFARNKWQTWWIDSGTKIANNWQGKAETYQAGWEFAYQQLNGGESPIPVAPGAVWIPDTYKLVLHFTNGDYSGRTKERWIIYTANLAR